MLNLFLKPCLPDRIFISTIPTLSDEKSYLWRLPSFRQLFAAWLGLVCALLAPGSLRPPITVFLAGRRSLGFALLGLLFAPRPARVVAGYFALAAAAFYYLIGSYPYWDGLSSFGIVSSSRSRLFLYLVWPFFWSLLLGNSPLSALPSFFYRCCSFASLRGTLVLSFSGALISFLCEGRFPGARWPTTNSRSYRTKSPCNFVPTYFRRRALMHQIEQRDIEQLNKSAEP